MYNLRPLAFNPVPELGQVYFAENPVFWCVICMVNGGLWEGKYRIFGGETNYSIPACNTSEKAMAVAVDRYTRLLEDTILEKV